MTEGRKLIDWNNPYKLSEHEKQFTIKAILICAIMAMIAVMALWLNNM
jgi:hypothetical protein